MTVTAEFWLSALSLCRAQQGVTPVRRMFERCSVALILSNGNVIDTLSTRQELKWREDAQVVNCRDAGVRLDDDRVRNGMSVGTRTPIRRARRGV
jgi:hypothetical protein